MVGEQAYPSTLTKRVVKGNNLVTRRIAGDTLIVPVRGHVAELDSIYTLNELGSLVWERIDGCTRIYQIVQAICEAYDIAAEQAARDLFEFLATLEEEGLIQIAADGER
jgi:hypothetical protein